MAKVTPMLFVPKLFVPPPPLLPKLVVTLPRTTRARIRQQRSTIDVVTRVTRKVQETWREGKLVGLLLMGIKSTAKHASQK